MHPFIHIGPLTLGSYGLMVAIGLICAFFILRADFARREVSADAEAIIGMTGLAGLAGSRLYHLLESPAEFFADPWPQLFSTMGFAFVGAILGGFIALVLLAKRFRMPILLMLDAASPAAAIGYGIGRIGCLISGDGDYGKPTALPWGMAFPNGIVPTTQSCVEWGAAPDCRVHPTPIYEFLAAILIFWILWRLGARGLKIHAPNGIIFAAYLVLTGIARFLVEIIRINPRSFYGLTNAQAASVVSILAGVALYVYCRPKTPRQSIRA
ncbi:MAG TPA: prolipoprotein diacylglyceryl transferase [Candidatus Acidoferrales bacterium]|nr:prolipoprotein diacylglyceryl transferase [Candidatus Acidoferrales bacterium]